MNEVSHGHCAPRFGQFLLGVLSMIACVSRPSLLAAEATGKGERPAPSLVFAFELRANVADPVVIGQGPHGL